MKKAVFLFVTVFALFAVSCAGGVPTGGNTPVPTALPVSVQPSVTVSNEPVVFPTESVKGEFSITTAVENGYTIEDGLCTITKGGTYVFSGKWKGQIRVNAGEEDKVILELNGFAAENDADSVVFAESADKLTVKAEKGTVNTLSDLRPLQTEEKDSDTAGTACIYSECDTEIEGKGTLTVKSTYHNGIHSKKDLTLKNLTLYVSAPDNALKGNDSVTVASGDITVVSTAGDGIKTTDSDISSKGNQRGTVKISGGKIRVYASCDAVDSAYDVEISGEAEIVLKTDKYAAEVVEGITTHVWNRKTQSFPWSGKTQAEDVSTKGVKADNAVRVTGGKTEISAVDDAMHANYGTILENGEKGAGKILISGGETVLISEDDAVHADYLLEISGGTVNVLSSYEGLEGNLVTVSGGNVTVYATDDGVNASGSFVKPVVTVSGGFLDVTVSDGDVDGIDSNGNYVQTGGFVVVRDGSSDASGNASGLDTDGTCSITGGTFVCVGPIGKTPSTSSGNCWVSFGNTAGGGRMQPGGPGGGFGHGGGFGPGGGMQPGGSTVRFSAGEYVLSGESGELFRFTLGGTYSALWISSDLFSVGKSYSLSGGGTEKTWKQNALYMQVG